MNQKHSYLPTLSIIIGALWVLLYVIITYTVYKTPQEYDESKSMQHIYLYILPILFITPIVLMYIHNGIRQQWSRTSTIAATLIAIVAIGTIVRVILNMQLMSDAYDYEKAQSLYNLFINIRIIEMFVAIVALGLLVDSLKGGITKICGIANIVIPIATFILIAIFEYYSSFDSAKAMYYFDKVIELIYIILPIAEMSIVFCYKFDTKK